MKKELNWKALFLVVILLFCIGADFSKPTLTSNYSTEFIQELKARIDEVGNMFSGTNTNLPVDARYIKLNYATAPSAIKRQLEKWNGASWDTILYLMPPGAVVPFAGATVPDGWLLCNGDAVSRTTYADLYAVIGVTWGAGDNSTTFNLPDFQDRFLVGKGSTFNSLAGIGGAASHTHSVPGHYHAMNGAGSNLAVDIDHNHGSEYTAYENSHTHTINHTHPAGTTEGASDSSHTHGITDNGHWHYSATGGAKYSTNFAGSATTILPHAGSSGTSSNIATSTKATGISINADGDPHNHAIPSHAITGDSGPGVQHRHTLDLPALGPTPKSVTGSIGKVTAGSDGNSDITTVGNNPPYRTINWIIKM